jgi:hypothetical protein
MDKFRRFGRGNPDKVRLARLKGELVDRPQAIAHVFKLARSERDAWLNWPARVSAQMAAKLGVDAHSMHVTLEAALRKCGGGNNCCIALQSISRLIRGRNLRPLSRLFVPWRKWGQLQRTRQIARLSGSFIGYEMAQAT